MVIWSLDGDQPWIFSEAPKRSRQGTPLVSLDHDFKDCLSLSAPLSEAPAPPPIYCFPRC